MQEKQLHLEKKGRRHYTPTATYWSLSFVDSSTFSAMNSSTKEHMLGPCLVFGSDCYLIYDDKKSLHGVWERHIYWIYI